MPVRMHAALLEEQGASVHFLGAMVAREFLLDAMDRLNPDYILVSMTVSPAKRVANEWFDAVTAAMSSNQHLLVGGMGAHVIEHLASDNMVHVGTESYSETLARVINT